MMLARHVSGIIAWPIRWACIADNDTSAMLRLVLIFHGPVLAASFLSPLTGGWALPVAFLWLLIVIFVVLCSRDPKEANNVL